MSTSNFFGQFSQFKSSHIPSKSIFLSCVFAEGSVLAVEAALQFFNECVLVRIFRNVRPQMSLPHVSERQVAPLPPASATQNAVLWCVAWPQTGLFSFRLETSRNKSGSYDIPWFTRNHLVVPWWCRGRFLLWPSHRFSPPLDTNVGLCGRAPTVGEKSALETSAPVRQPK